MAAFSEITDVVISNWMKKAKEFRQKKAKEFQN